MENGAWTKSSQVSICNKALGFMGVGRAITSLMEATAEAGVMKRYYDAALTSLLQRNDWNFCRGMVDLASVVRFRPRRGLCLSVSEQLREGAAAFPRGGGFTS